VKHHQSAIANGRRRIACANAAGKNLWRAAFWKRIKDAFFFGNIIAGGAEESRPIICGCGGAQQ
jgi:hypothetical protein